MTPTDPWRAGLKEGLKQGLGQGLRLLLPQCRFERSIFLLAHMRCGSTALSNILCSRPDISGYGEAHIRYDGPAALGRLVVNQARRGSFRPGAAHLFDKILHDRHDAQAPPGFFAARAIFLARRPGPSIRSIRDLFRGIGREDEYPDDAAAARYYVTRLDALARLWARFPPDRRVGLTFGALIRDPEAELSRISAALRIVPALENRYVSPAASRRGGGGDPTQSGRFTRIEPRRDDPARDAAVPLDIPEALRDQAEAAYLRFEAMIRGG
ncbi:sulfotransferase family protein [Rhodobacter capsulatus]|uniref:sulfotransferase family protein n=1 Tax=Rhodobacter capsulatus TaxID=1061 RepID=UPI0003D2DA92|nr:sulfotransferase [Rhodobacter capsulatus]ETD01703.1 hypothetical protein U714_11010 [Rhodobacter capsulatus DE442]ETD76771.1 hypothetical protein U717_11165 [Rhodobacter capsulatus R121]ETE53608.1 hypothetical protein U715_11170 [Rhodobacter capsulatus Y262]MDS0927412.1 sulfotransferase [Rhodobacter capsulatus]TQD35346.1 sulfotransferase [Rhodobacter capsulatus]